MKNKFIIEWTGGTVLPTEATTIGKEFLAFLKKNNANITQADLVIDGKTTSVLREHAPV